MIYGISLGNSRLGRFAVDYLIKKGVSPSDIVAVVRSPEKANDLIEQGITVRKGEYGDAIAFEKALEKVDRLYMISGMAKPAERIAQHRSVIDAARKAGVKYIAYTSFLDSKENSPFFAWTINKNTENYLKDSGIKFTVLRSGMYSEADLDYIPQYLKDGKIANNIGDGKISYISRRDLVDAAVHCLVNDDHLGHTYELTGHKAITQTELAAIISKWTGKDIPYVTLSDVEYRASFPEPFWADVVVTLYQSVRDGNLQKITDDFEKIVGRRPYDLSETLEKFYK